MVRLGISQQNVQTEVMATQKERKALRNSTSKKKKKGSKRNFLSKEDSSSSDEDSNSKEEANERVFLWPSIIKKRYRTMKKKG